MRLLTVVGARPQFIKAAAVSRAICTSGGFIQEQILHTGQHYDVAMSDQFFSELGIPRPDFHLGIGGGTHGVNTGRMLEAIERVLMNVRPDAVMVYGDTDSTLAGALASSKLKIPVIHVEAGLRSFNRHQPEEQNRVLTDHLADLCFAPTDTAVDHLKREGIPAERIVLTGDVMADATRIFGALAVAQEAKLLVSSGLQVLHRNDQPFVLATIHRAENTDPPDRLESILTALGTIATSGAGGFAPIPVVMPLHPRTQARIESHQLQHLLEPLIVTPPPGFLLMMLLESRACLVVTDSGGVQKEAFFQGTPCVTVRDETEWVELLATGWNQLAAPVSTENIVNYISMQLDFNTSTPRPPLYGDGFASSKIIQSIQALLS